MNILAETFWVPKRGNLPEEYEDAACPAQRCEYTDAPVRLAVADGATESVFARKWAQQLVQAVAAGDLSPRCLSEGVGHLRAHWREWLRDQTLPWYAEEKASQGSLATLVALEIACEAPGDSNGSWLAVAVGDSCLFHVRRDEVLAKFPLDHSTQFSNHPFLLSTVASEEDPLHEKVSSGEWLTGDVFLLMTDALACWFLKSLETYGRPLDVLHNAPFSDEPDSFRSWLKSLRDEGAIRNDDCTLIRAQLR